MPPLDGYNICGASTTIGDTVLNQDFKEFIRSLNDNRVRYLVIGGYAVAFHGHPRYTKDMDVWIGHGSKKQKVRLTLSVPSPAK